MKNVLAKIKDIMIGPEYDDYEEEIVSIDDIEEKNYIPKTPKSTKDISATAGSSPKRTPSSSVSDKVVSIHANKQMEVVLTRPKDVDDANILCDHIKDNKTIVVNLEDVDREESQRIVDFLSGVTYALDGDFQPISARIFIAAPHNVDITAQLKEEIKATSSILPWVR